MAGLLGAEAQECGIKLRRHEFPIPREDSRRWLGSPQSAIAVACLHLVSVLGRQARATAGTQTCGVLFRTTAAACSGPRQRDRPFPGWKSCAQDGQFASCVDPLRSRPLVFPLLATRLVRADLHVLSCSVCTGPVSCRVATRYLPLGKSKRGAKVVMVRLRCRLGQPFLPDYVQRPERHWLPAFPLSVRLHLATEWLNRGRQDTPRGPPDVVQGREAHGCHTITVRVS